tara:strand:+ start:753 stop:908 length:156 start_codon:yes stop_codon:yes gene_type:complete
MYITDDTCFKVYAMDLKDAYETLLENEPTVSVHDIQFVKEHKCASVQESIH